MTRDLDFKYKSNEKNQIWNIDVGLRRDQKLPELAAPPGFSSDRERSIVSDVKQTQDDNHNNLVDKRSWDIALGPIKSLPMNMFIMYMAGSHISIFPIMMVGMMFFRPIQALMGIRSTMRMLECSNQYVLQTFMYTVGNCLSLMLAVYKCNAMGLLPTHPSDWLAFVEPQQRMEFVDGGMRL